MLYQKSSIGLSLADMELVSVIFGEDFMDFFRAYPVSIRDVFGEGGGYNFKPYFAGDGWQVSV